MRFDLVNELWRTRRTALLALVLLLALNAVIYAVMQQFVVPKVDEHEALFIQKQTEVRRLVKQQSSASESPEQIFLRAGQDLEAFYRALPEHREFTSLVDELMTLASMSGLHLTQIAYNPEQLKEMELLRYTISFTVGGDYGQIKKFIHTLEQSPRVMAIRDILLHHEAGSRQPGVRLRLNLETYFSSEEREA
ncbi:MAG: type 4a pilus biogenesis protein PilO [Desulfuromonadales bacterium]|nr:type 4a pilus biogenesis protein PilO [Desulfuromonadales bacterium]